MGLNILIVDDSATMRAMIKHTLDMSGVPLGEVHEAGSGQEGLDLLAAAWIDLALIDINMPGMNGVELIDRLRADPEFSHIPVVVVSAETSETRIGTLKERGVTVIHKPFTPELVREVLARLLGADWDASP
ncbi:MAG: response regulator [Planctomycetota bacterium]